jgi:2-keto-4-pentenoate hydratase
MAALAAALMVAASGYAAAPGEGPAPAWMDDVAQRIYDAWRAGEAMPQVSPDHPEATLADGYEVQERFVKRILQHDKVGGFKAAVVGAAGQANLGVDGPLTGVVPASGVLDADDDIVVDLADYPNRHLETEIGYAFKKAVKKPLPDVETLREHVKSVLPIVEVPGGATEDKQPSTAADVVAWNGNAKAIICGAPHDPDAIDEDAVEITFTRDGEVINQAKGGQAAGGQWNTLLKSVNNLVERGYAIKGGHVLTNGALGDVLPAEPGEYRAHYGPLGVIAFTVTDSSAEE